MNERQAYFSAAPAPLHFGATNHTRLIHLVQLLLLAALGGFSVQVDKAFAAAGALDTTLAGTGKLRLFTGGGSQACNGVAVQSDGKLVLAGVGSIGTSAAFEVLRMETNGVIESSFGLGGAVFTPFFDQPTASALASAVLVQIDGKIVVGGGAGFGSVGDFAMARYNPDGSLDTTFGGGGKVLTDFGVPASIAAMTLQADGKIVVAGGIANGPSGNNFILARYLTNGTLDASFGTAGAVITDVGSTHLGGGAGSVLIEADGRILAAGNGQDASRVVVTRYTTNGVLDTTFGGTGKVFALIPGLGDIFPVSLGYQLGNNSVSNPDKILAATSGDFPGDSSFALIRFNLDGSLDNTFGTGGIVTNSFGSGLSQSAVFAILIQGFSFHPRKITIAGYADSINGISYAMARFNADGSLDTTFGTNATGKVMVGFDPGGQDLADAMTVQSGQLVLAGQAAPAGGNAVFSAVRFNSTGALDTTFGSNGLARADFAPLPSRAQGVAIQPDGKLVIAGLTSNYSTLFAIDRCNADGSFDTQFGSNGHVFTAVGPTNCGANAILLQPDGKIVAAGYGYGAVPGGPQEVALVRYNANGSLDGSFGTGGIVLTSVGGAYDVANAAALQPDGKIVVAGNTQNGSAIYEFGLARLTANGTLDPSFAGTGKVITSFAGGHSLANAARLQPDGKIVVAGYAQIFTGGSSTTNFAVVRYNSDGSIDQSFGPFGAFGKVSTDFGPGTSSAAYAMELQPDGRLLLAGSAFIGGTSYVALVRYTTNGLLDLTFGAGGKVIDQVGATNELAVGVGVQTDGKTVVGVLTQRSNIVKFAAVRYAPNGSRDLSFGTAGQAVASFDDGNDVETGLVLDQVNRPVMFGSAAGFGAIARLTSEPVLKFTSINPAGNGQFLLRGIGVPDANHTLYSAPGLGAGFNALAPVTADAGGLWQFLDTNAPAFSRQFYRLSYP